MNSFIRTHINRLLVFCLIVSMALGNIPISADSTTIKDLNKSSSFAKQAIVELVEKNIIKGDNYGNFNPMDNLTKGQMIVIIARALALNTDNLPEKATFKDVPKSHWAFPYVEAAYKKGIVTGNSKDVFGVNDNCNREQMTAMFVRALGVTEDEISKTYGTQSISKLADKTKISGWSKNYVEYALSTGLMSGTSSNTFSPKEYAKREQAAVVTHRFLYDSSNPPAPAPSGMELTLKQIAAMEESVVIIQTFDKAGNPLAQGSGFAVANGLFVTNYHVLEGASKYTIIDSKEKEYQTEGIVKYDADLDLAIIKSKAALNIKPLNLGTKASMSKGDSIAAIGSPQGLQNSISEGIISGFRDFEIAANRKVNIIQITAAISQGSSGGPLFDMRGNVIGVTSAMTEDGTQKFAIAIDYIKPWVQELKSKVFSSISVLDMSKVIDEYWMTLDEDLKSALEKSFQAMENEDVEAYINTIHKLNPAYSTIRETYGKLFSIYNFDYTMQEIKLLERTTSTAKLEAKYTLKRTSKGETVTLAVTGNYSLALYNGGWRIYNASETYQPINGSGWPTGDDLKPTPTPPADPGTPGTGGTVTETPLTFRVKDSVIHPTKPIIYISDKFNSKVISYNYLTKAVKEKSFTLTPESITFNGNEVYVALLKTGHNSYIDEDKQQGAIAILDENLSLKEQYDINTDPFDVVIGRDGNIYVPSGSGQFTTLKSYSRNGMKEISSTHIDEQSFTEAHPTVDKIYTMTSRLSPTSIYAYNFKNGIFTDPVYPGGIRSSYHGDYPMGYGFKISPDGKFIFTKAGTIFSCALNPFEVITYHDKLQKGFNDITFDLGNNRFFTAIKGGLIYEYEYPSFKGTHTYQVQGEIVQLYYRDNKLIALTMENDKYFAELVDMNK